MVEGTKTLMHGAYMSVTYVYESLHVSPKVSPSRAQYVDVKFGTKKVDYGATPEEIQAHFSACGTINRVTILLDKFTGHPKGCAPFSFRLRQLLVKTRAD